MPDDRLQSLPPVIPETIRGLVAHYRESDSPLNHEVKYALPQLRATLGVLSGVKDLLFPDHRLSHEIRQGETERLMSDIAERVYNDLRRQIYLAFARDSAQRRPCPLTTQQADRAAETFMARLSALRRVIAEDVQAAADGDPAAQSYDEIVFCYPGFEAIATYRIAHELHQLRVPLLPRIWTEHAHRRTGTDIHPGAQIGRSFFIDHATGVVIGETTVIGDRVKLYQGVTLGALSFPKDAQGRLVRDAKRHPTIEDDVVIYAGATVLGGETVIGRGAVIGGSCWITRSIPPGTKVILNEPQMKFAGPHARAATASPAPDWCI